jgi:hypothetical protein
MDEAGTEWGSLMTAVPAQPLARFALRVEEQSTSTVRKDQNTASDGGVASPRPRLTPPVMSHSASIENSLQDLR